MTPRRYYALRWFADHEDDQNSVMGRRVPSGKMRLLMAREGQVMRVPVGAFNYNRWILTAHGREILAAKGKKHAQAKTPTAAAG